MSRLTKLGAGQMLLSVLYPTPTDDSKLDIQEAMMAMCQSRDWYVKFGILQNKIDTDIVYGNWLSTFDDVKATYDDKRCQWYTTLPAPVIGLPNDQGVYHVWNSRSPENMFIPIPPAYRAIYKNSQALGLEGETGYYLLEDRIYYSSGVDEDTCISMNLVAESSSLGEYDYFPVDTSCLQDILKRAIEIYSVQKKYSRRRTK